MAEVKQISASIKMETIKAVNVLSGKESRSFSSMVDILLKEAVEARISKKIHIPQ